MNLVKVVNWWIVIIGLFVFSGCGDQNDSFSYESHFSKVFNREKHYTLYLPNGYDTSQKTYPVVYFFHGWGGRYFKDDSALLEYEMLGDLVDKYQVILIMWDGNIEEIEERPYNVGNHDKVKFDVQMKDYFIELVNHVDSTYRTKNDRNSRGTIGYSMGGYMSYFLSGKYPDMISAAVNMTGSPEFFIGYPNNHTHYPLRYTFSNLTDVKLRFHNSSVGEISPLNREVHQGALWENDLDYQYWEFEGGHMVDKPGETKVFEMALKFIVDAFNNPTPRKEKWSHYDLYPDFEVWDYTVNSDKYEPGFLYLDDVSKEGFGFYTKKWLPLGPPLRDFQTSITTAPIYKSNTNYTIRRYDKKLRELETLIKTSDSEGRLHFNLLSSGYELGIYEQGDGPKLTFLDYEIRNNKKLLRVGDENRLSLKLANLGEKLEKTSKIKLTLSTNDSSVSIENRTMTLMPKSDDDIIYSNPFSISCSKSPPTDGSPAEIRFLLTIEDELGITEEDFIVPVFFDVPTFKTITIDDGALVRASIFGSGNGDRAAQPGEKIMIYTEDHRTQLFTDDPYVISADEKIHTEMTPAKWDDGITLSSIVKISDKCPNNHIIRFLARYETKIFHPIEREVKWGKVEVKVSGKRND